VQAAASSGRLDRGIGARFLAVLAFWAAASAASADAGLAVAHVNVGSHPLKVEVAATDAQRAQGLMFRTALGRDDGMLFVFDDPGYYAMWMKNTLIPLSVAFIDGDGVILNIVDMEPRTLDSHVAAGPARYAIETNRGWFQRHQVKPGDKVSGLPAGH
jgi:uncharacterized protein